MHCKEYNTALSSLTTKTGERRVKGEHTITAGRFRTRTHIGLINILFLLVLFLADDGVDTVRVFTSHHNMELRYVAFRLDLDWTLMPPSPS